MIGGENTSITQCSEDISFFFRCVFAQFLQRRPHPHIRFSGNSHHFPIQFFAVYVGWCGDLVCSFLYRLCCCFLLSGLFQVGNVELSPRGFGAQVGGECTEEGGVEGDLAAFEKGPGAVFA